MLPQAPGHKEKPLCANISDYNNLFRNRITAYFFLKIKKKLSCSYNTKCNRIPIPTVTGSYIRSILCRERLGQNIYLSRTASISVGGLNTDCPTFFLNFKQKILAVSSKYVETVHTHIELLYRLTPTHKQSALLSFEMHSAQFLNKLF